KRRDSLYTKGFQLFKPRPDLAANVKLLQGEMWEEAGNNNSAGRAYLEALLMFKTESHVVTSAFRHVDDLYEKTNRPRDALRTYSRIWATLKRPTSNFGFKSSLYKLMGDRLAELLADAGNLREAGKIKRQIEQTERSLSW
ncbi:MAG: hypothetical protein QF662_06420, partial [Phycisphaerae bacterium]|nr:hypothetical protein [Phycisphaerae bacterium]